MNPYDLPGPEFLLFYIGTMAAVICIVYLVQRAVESGPVPTFGDVDPYFIAHLRGGDYEALRVATIALLDRGLLKADGVMLTAQARAVERVRRPIERKILENFVAPLKAERIFTDSGAIECCRAFENELLSMGLLPSRKQRMIRFVLGLAAVFVLLSIALTKMDIAAQRGHRNITFLVILALIGPIVIVILLMPRRTALGNRVLLDLETLFSGLCLRAPQIRPGGATNELVLLAGVYGLGALSGDALAQAKTLFPLALERGRGGSSWSTQACGQIPAGDSGGGGGGCGGGGCGGGGCGGCGG